MEWEKNGAIDWIDWHGDLMFWRRLCYNLYASRRMAHDRRRNKWDSGSGENDAGRERAETISFACLSTAPSGVQYREHGGTWLVEMVNEQTTFAG